MKCDLMDDRFQTSLIIKCDCCSYISGICSSLYVVCWPGTIQLVPLVILEKANITDH